MKTNLRILTLAAALCVGLFTATAADKHKSQGRRPKADASSTRPSPQAEFVVEKDRTVTINFYNDEHETRCRHRRKTSPSSPTPRAARRRWSSRRKATCS